MKGPVIVQLISESSFELSVAILLLPTVRIGFSIQAKVQTIEFADGIVRSAKTD